MTKELFCIRIDNDVVAAPSRTQASDAADQYNRLYADAEPIAHDDAWPYGPESHFHSLTKGWPDYVALAQEGRRRRLANK